MHYATTRSSPGTRREPAHGRTLALLFVLLTAGLVPPAEAIWDNYDYGVIFEPVDDAYDVEELEKDTRVVLRFHPEIAPITVGVFPLVKKHGMPEKAHEVEEELRRAGFTTFYDEKAAIGRRYRRQDEIGTPYCVTIDGDTLAEDAVTVRERDSMEQARVQISEVRTYLEEAMRGWSR